MDKTNPNRRPPGTPAGGQFAPSTHPESEVRLDESEAFLPSVRTPGYRSLRAEMEAGSDGDAWGSTMEWWHATADALWHADEGIPDSWEYRHSPVCDGDDDSWAFARVREALDGDEATPEDLRTFGDALGRYSALLRRAGRGY